MNGRGVRDGDQRAGAGRRAKDEIATAQTASAAVSKTIAVGYRIEDAGCYLMPRERSTVKQHYSAGYPKGQRIAQTEGEAGS